MTRSCWEAKRLRNLRNFNHSNPVMNFDVGICRFFYRLHFWDKQISCCQLPRFTFQEVMWNWFHWAVYLGSRIRFNVVHLVPTLCNFLEEKGFVFSWSSRVKHDFDGSVSIFQSKSSNIFQFKVYLKGCAPNLQSLLLKPPTTGANIAWAAKNGLDVGQICQRPGRQNDMEIY